MDPKRKKIYIILIAVCLILSVGILVWSRSSTSVPDFSDLSNSKSSGNTAVVDQSGFSSNQTSFPAPEVFPRNPEYNTQILESAEFKLLEAYSALDVSDQLGRDDPFKNY